MLHLMLCLFAGVSLALTSAQALELRCPMPNIVIDAADRLTAMSVCEGAGDAVRFLSGEGLDTSTDIEIHILDRLPAGIEFPAAGCYIHAERCVYALTLDKFSEQARSIGQSVDPLLYRSLITHEVAHAIAASNFSVPKPTIQAHEYVAYVTMFSTMSDSARQHMLDGLPGDGFETEQQMTATIYLLAPSWFGAQAYRHYLRPGNGRTFLRKVLDGSVLGGTANGR